MAVFFYSLNPPTTHPAQVSLDGTEGARETTLGMMAIFDGPLVQQKWEATTEPHPAAHMFDASIGTVVK